MFSSLQGDGRVWIYVANRVLEQSEQEAICEHLKSFCSSWAAHGNQLAADFAIFHHQILVLAIDENVEAATGCSIDKATAIFQQIETQLDVDLFNRMNLAFRTAEGIRLVKLQDVNQAYHSGLITDETLLLDNTITSLAELKQRWEVPFKSSWAFRKIKSIAV